MVYIKIDKSFALPTATLIKKAKQLWLNIILQIWRKIIMRHLTQLLIRHEGELTITV